MKKKILFIFSLLLIAAGVFCQTNDELKDALTILGLSPTVVTIVLAGLGIVGQFIPNKWYGVTLYLERLCYGIYLALHKVNEKLNNLSPKQKMLKVETDRRIKEATEKLKGVGITVRSIITAFILMFVLSAGVDAQKWDGFFKPADAVVKASIVKAADTDEVKPAWFFRPSVSLTAMAIDFSQDEPVSLSLSAMGFGISYGKFTTVNDQAYCNYSFNLALLTTMDFANSQETHMGVSGTVDVFNKLVGAGVGAYLDAGKVKPLLLMTISYSF